MKITIAPEDVKRIGIVGTGVIGCGWAAHFLAQGLDVVAYDPHLQAEQRLRTAVSNAWPVLEQLGLAEGASPARLGFTASIEEALSEVDFIQESTPENRDIKEKVMTSIENASRPDVVIASSTSGFLPSTLQASCRHPERVVVGHPFNPVYLMPLVEVVGGQQTSSDIIEWTMGFYQYVGKQPVQCRTETPAHLANRLQEAVLREMLHLVAEGIATTGELDAVLSGGPGLRWALMGAGLTFFLSSGGVTNMRQLLDWWGPDLQANLSKMMPPEITEDLVDRMTAGIKAQAAGRNVQELERIRDEFLVGTLKLRADIEAKYGFSQSRFL